MIVLNSKVAVKQFVEQDMELLASLAAVASLKLRNIGALERDAHSAASSRPTSRWRATSR